MPRVVHFEIPADDPAASQAFYEAAFGWGFYKWEGPEPYWLITTGPEEEPGINGGMMQKNPGQPVTFAIDVPDIDASIAAVQSAGGTIVVPKMPIPGVGWISYFTDPTGNVIGIHQNDPSAA